MKAALELLLLLVSLLVGIHGGEGAPANAVQSITAGRALFAGGLSGACQVGLHGW